MSTPAWLTPVSWLFVGMALLCAAFLMYDILVRGYRQRVGAMNAVWPLTALYFGPVAIWAYLRYGRPRSEKAQAETGAAPERDVSAAALTGGTPGGAAYPMVRFLLARGVKAVA